MKRLLVTTAVLMVLAVLTTGCQPILRFATGVRKPAPVTMTYIQKKEKHYNLNEFEHLATTKAGASLYVKVERSEVDSEWVFYKPLIFKYDTLLIVQNYHGCGPAYTYLQNPQDTIIYKFSDSLNIQDFANSTCLCNFDSCAFYSEIKDVEYVIFIYWASFNGVFDKNSSKQFGQFVQKQIRENGLNAKAYYVNYDFKKEE